MNTIDLSKLPDGLTLSRGHHDIGSTSTGCAMDAIAWAATGEVTDMPACVHPILARKVHKINDDQNTAEADRWLIVREAGPILVGSNEWTAVQAAWCVSRAGSTAAGFVAAVSADLTRADLTRADLAGADLTEANLARANLTRANLTGANLADADLTRADLTRANLARAYLAGADLTRANLAGANLARVNLAGANLAGANLAGAYLTEAYLAEAKADKWTRWPDGFDPVARGVQVLA
jgi:hypothetical protein